MTKRKGKENKNENKNNSKWFHVYAHSAFIFYPRPNHQTLFVAKNVCAHTAHIHTHTRGAERWLSAQRKCTWMTFRLFFHFVSLSIFFFSFFSLSFGCCSTINMWRASITRYRYVVAIGNDTLVTNYIWASVSSFVHLGSPFSLWAFVFSHIRIFRNACSELQDFRYIIFT